jgi:hypothetical protein
MRQRTGPGERIQLPDPEMELALPKLDGDLDGRPERVRSRARG